MSTALVGWDVLKDARHREAAAARELADWLQSMEEIQQLLGHESIRTTSDIYVSTNLGAIGDHMREVVGDRL